MSSDFADNGKHSYIMYHCHTDYSLLDSCTKPQSYIDLAKRDGMKALSFSEHGKISNWTEKWGACKEAGIRYIHSVEIYLTETLDEKIRDNYHTVLMARNMEGVKELNLLVKKSFDEDHFYYNNRITFDEFLGISGNIISTSACLASPLNKLPEDHPRYEELVQKYDFLEVQAHNHPEQIAFNQRLLRLSRKYGIPLIAGTDTHSSSPYKAECRAVLLSSKGKSYGDEDTFDLTYKTYDELVEMFRVQGALPEEEYMQAIENTNLLYDMTEEIELDTSIKYPILYGSREADSEMFVKVVEEKFADKLEKGIIPRTQEAAFREAIDEEMRVFQKLHMDGFMLSMSELITWCKEQGMAIGTARGSVGGSRVAYVTDIIDLNPETWHTIFSRFANEDREEINTISNVDIYRSRRTVMCAKINLLNCWDALKLVIPQRRDEISPSVTVTKVERNNWMMHGQILNISNGQSAAKSRIVRSSTTIPAGSSESEVGDTSIEVMIWSEDGEIHPVMQYIEGRWNSELQRFNRKPIWKFSCYFRSRI